ncbi:MAG: hypothetical protein C0490_10235 [Marivirga sp.]|nr:hypothetical protein [Marivirga sp.]
MKLDTAQILRFVLSIIGIGVSLCLNAQQKEKYNVAIFLYQDVELLDFAGPGEVFSAAGFNVYTVSVDGKEIVSQRFVKVTPSYSIENSPVPDIIVFPGGHSTPSSKDTRVLDWIKTRVSAGTTAMSVCTGAEILANAGMLKGLNVTTFHGFIPGLQEMLPDSKVLTDTRFVDSGNIITTAGVSAGIDGALHLVSRIKGMDVAKATAFYMEYDKWKPEDGRVDYKNENLEKIITKPSTDRLENKSVQGNMAKPQPIPFEGELKNFAVELQNKGSYSDAAKVLEAAIKWYPRSIGSYNELSIVYNKLGRPSPPNESSFLKLIEEGKIDEAVQAYEKAQAAYPGWIVFGEGKLNDMGYRFMEKQDFKNAVKIFQLNAKAYPTSANVFDSLGEGFMRAGNKKEALANYKKSLDLDPGNTNAKQMLDKLEGKI